MSDGMVPAFVGADLEKAGIEVPAEKLEKLARYLDLLLEANQRMNLTAVRDRDLAWRRLIVDSLTLLPGLESVEAGGRLVDVGSGGGLPGIPLAIAREDLHISLLEATGKKAKFLHEARQALGLKHGEVLHGRAEEFGQNKTYRQKFDVAVSRAVGKVSEVLEYALPLVKVGGRALLLKASKAEEELAAAGDALAQLGAGDLQVFEAYPQEFNSELVIISVMKDRATPALYPRRPGIPRTMPL